MMNERINELFGQALDDAVPETWTTLNPAQLSRLKEKFAELIVKECRAMAIQKLAIGSDKYTESHNGALWSVINEIDEHFGVEEEK